MENNQIPIIDLFAGPGGLGEGFTSLVNNKNVRQFKIALSIEKDPFAHATLTLRSFLRQFPFQLLPEEYYQFLRQEISLEDLYNKYPSQYKHAQNEAWRFELGTAGSHDELDKRIRKALKGERDFLLIGGPPCQAYSLVGRARRQEKIGLKKDDIRVYLYREYYRILAVHRPPVFIMENVKGLLSSKVENESIFQQLINDLTDPIKSYKKLQGQETIYKSGIHYKIYSLVKKPELFDSFGQPVFKPTDFIIQSEKYGIPQTRHRVILLGIRSDLNITPDILTPFGRNIAVEEVINGLPVVRSGLSKKEDALTGWLESVKSLKNLRLENEINDKVWSKILDVLNKMSDTEVKTGALYIKAKSSINYNSSWFLDKKLNGVVNHQSRSHIKEDLFRYLFVSCFASVIGRSPKIFEFPSLLQPKHLNASDGKFTDRFRTQIYGKPSKTVTSHISKDGHYFIHPDPGQCRSFTVREAARIQTFPDNYFFCGPRTQQFHQVGNAVPPLLAQKIAEIIIKIFVN